MKTIFLSVLLCISYNAIDAQDWCHQGSVWNYSWSSLGGPGEDIYTYTKDTVVYSRPCHQLAHTQISDLYQGNNQYALDTAAQLPLYTYANADTTYFYYYIFSEWLPTYFMNAQVGDTLLIPNYAFITNSDTSVLAIVDSADNVLIDTNHLRYYTFHIIDSCPLGMLYQQGKATVVERLGMISNDMVPFWHCTTDDTYYGLCSYQDSSFVITPSIGCPSLPTGINEIKPISFRCQPNPAQDEVTISIDGSMIRASLSISDIDGRNILDTQLTNIDNKIQVSDLANGIYLLTISQNERQAASRKLVIAR